MKPSDIVKRCLWDKYVMYIVGDENKAEALLNEDAEFEMSERDALVMGFITRLETDNLIAMFNKEIIQFITYKTFDNDGKAYVRKNSLELVIKEFKTKFPAHWKAPINYVHRLGLLNTYIEDTIKAINTLKVTQVTIKNITYDVIPSTQVKKVLKLNNY